MQPRKPTYEEGVIKLLCEIRDMLAQQYAAGSCIPCQPPLGDTLSTSFSLTTTPAKILSNDPKRLSFTIFNTAATGTVFIGIVGNVSATNGVLAAIAAGKSQQFTAYNFPVNLTREWYALSSAGTIVTNVITEFTTEALK